MLGSPFLSGNVIVQGPSWDLLWHAYAVDQSTLDPDTDLNRDRPTYIVYRFIKTHDSESRGQQEAAIIREIKTT